MFSNDLRGLVLLNALGSDVPGADVPPRVEHENRIILYGFDQQPKLIFSFPRDSALERNGLPLPRGDSPQSLPAVRIAAIFWRSDRQDVRALSVHFEDWRRVIRIVADESGISTQKREGVLFRQVIPESFEANRFVSSALSPQQSENLAQNENVCQWPASKVAHCPQSVARQLEIG